jgi:Flp pilus assembly pilin Flp
VRDAGGRPERPITACNRQGGAAPQEMRQLEESRRGQSTDHNSSDGNDPPPPSKGGELVLKLFAFTQAFALDALRRREEGQTMAEYGIVLTVITLAVVAAITLLSTNVQNAIEQVAGVLQ